MTTAISIQQVGKTFGAVRALDDVSFDIITGELHAIMGENGAGKSTLMKILAGVITQYDGALVVDGNRAAFQGTRDAEASGISIIHQELNLVEQLSVAANIFLGRELTRFYGFLNHPEMERRATVILAELESGIAPDALVSTLRVGDQQLVEIARALMLQTRILIMDEPTSALTEAEVARLYRVIERLRAKGVTILYISHKMDEVFHLSDRITVLRDGRFVQTVATKDTNPREIAHLMVGREISVREKARTIQAADVVLEVKNLSLPWPGRAGKWRLKDVSFRLRKGEILGVAGLMGAGRTELLECLFGASEHRSTGDILLDGRACDFRHPAQAMQAGIAMVTEDRKRLGLFSQLSVGENISISALSEVSSAGIISGSRERAAVTDQIRTLRVRTASEEAGITTLSGGNQQKCIIARCLLTEPRVLLLDDPTRGVDIGAKSELYQLMEDLASNGMSILVTSSELPELLSVCDRILVLKEGRLTAEFAASDATEQKIMEAATGPGL
ncbi:MAG: sugar ABC transporter ATP-binding protein [Planctomycetaceae bacterium]|nr:sugar ABC transporter ATP-binding protein [Planctomycetaceae bacterium]